MPTNQSQTSSRNKVSSIFFNGAYEVEGVRSNNQIIGIITRSKYPITHRKGEMVKFPDDDFLELERKERIFSNGAYEVKGYRCKNTIVGTVIKSNYPETYAIGSVVMWPDEHFKNLRKEKLIKISKLL